MLFVDKGTKLGTKNFDKINKPKKVEMSEEKLEVAFVNYDWDAIVDWAKEKCEKQDQTESAAAEDLLEDEPEEQFVIIDEVEIKQEIVLDPNE